MWPFTEWWCPVLFLVSWFVYKFTRNKVPDTPTHRKQVATNTAQVQKEPTTKPTGTWWDSFQSRTLSLASTSDDFDELENQLLAQQLTAVATRKIRRRLETQMREGKLNSWHTLRPILQREVTAELSEIICYTKAQFMELIHKPGSQKPYVIAFVAGNGVGKTTSVAKMAHFLIKEQKRVAIAACDTFRSGAIEQLRVHADSLGVPLFAKEYGKDPASVGYQAIEKFTHEKVEVVLLDTAGRSQNRNFLMQLQKIVRVTKPDMVLFLGEAQSGHALAEQCRDFDTILGEVGRKIDAFMITKCDLVGNKVGTILSLPYTEKRPLLLLGTGQQYLDLQFPTLSDLVPRLF
jgi:fused signal recognition particle receptor